MKALFKTAGPIAALLTVSGLCLSALADIDTDRFQTIPERNVFGLREPPPPVQTNTAPEPKPSNVKLTGFTSILSPPRALIMVQEPGNKNSSYVLREGQREGSILVKSINLEKGEVRISNGPNEELLTFESHGIKPTMAAAPQPTAAPDRAAAAQARARARTPGGTPQVINANNAATAAQIRSRYGIDPSGTSGATPDIPSRQVRFRGAPGGQQIQNNALPAQTLEEALPQYLINRELARPDIEAGLLPPLPPVPDWDDAPVPPPPGTP
ncbi:MAG TPA: hypothetical protein VMS21_03845 [Methylomirabilota bacterium]|nr:hypothetical protein [Methylomirabilota bacterium]